MSACVQQLSEQLDVGSRGSPTCGAARMISPASLVDATHASGAVPPATADLSQHEALVLTAIA